MSDKVRTKRHEVRLLQKDRHFMSVAAKKLGDSESDALRIGAYVISKLSQAKVDEYRRMYRTATES